MVIVNDTEAPKFVVRPADRQVVVGQPTDPDATGRATASDNCTAPPRIAMVDLVIPGGIAPVVSTIKRTWTATDGAENQVSFVQTITVVSTVPPALQLTVPADLTVECGIGIVPAKTGHATATTGTGCGPVTITYTDTSSNSVPPAVKVVTRTWKATDGCGNTVTKQQKITIQDTTGPKIHSLTATPAALVPANGQMVTVKVARVVEDNCSTISQIKTTPTVKVTDPAGNDGKTYFVIKSLNEVTLRAKKGVSYTLKLTSKDAFGNTTSKSIVVPVP